MERSQAPHIVVLGAGIIGLQTALTLASTDKYAVTIVAKFWPGDDADMTYTSPKTRCRAGAHWRSQGPHDEWFDTITYRHWQELVRSGEQNIGVESIDTFYYWEEHTPETEHDAAALWWKSLVSDFRVLPAEDLPAGSVFGVSYKGFSINPTTYMNYILSRVKSLGVKIVRTEVPTLREVFRLPGLDSALAVVNCCGISAKALVGDGKVYSTKGQTLLVEGECEANKFRQTRSGWVDAVIRRPGAGTIFGVSKDENDWSDHADERLSQMILERCTELVPELPTSQTIRIISTNVGWRPSREDGVRIETERLTVGNSKKIVCHHYGHAGGGFQNSVGSAIEAVKTLEEAIKLESTSAVGEH